MKNDAKAGSAADLDIAIIGFACRFPGAQNADEFWLNLRSGKECITFFTDAELAAAGVAARLLADPAYVKAAPILADIDKFDAQLFGYSPREARSIDPQQRLFLECAWEALEMAGYDPPKYAGSIGVFAGSALNTYLLFSGLLEQFRKEYLLTLIGNDKDYLATRTSYKLNLTGPSVTVQTACSTSLVAIHLACQSLLNGECEMALAGGVSIRVPHLSGYLYQPGSVFSPDGHCRTFDAQAQGTIFGSGVGIVVLKPLTQALRDGDFIQALVKGSAINNDGASKVEFTAPSVVSQSEAVVEALANADVDARSLSYVEAHGTGTSLGDPIEVAALTRAFRVFTKEVGFCALGTAKTHIGHMDAAAGVAGLIKTILSLRHQEIPPILHFERPNPEINFADSPFYVGCQLRPWKRGALPRRAGINSLGMGGTNAFLIVEEAPVMPRSGASRPYHLLLISAKTESALEILRQRLADFLQAHPAVPLADIAFTLQTGRRDMEWRRLYVCQNREEALRELRNQAANRTASVLQRSDPQQLAFMFSGQGTQYVGMGLELYQTEAVFREWIDRCLELLRPHLSIDLRDILYPESAAVETAARLIQRTEFAQPAIFSVEYALAKLWMGWGLHPDLMIGHSLGEYVAACLAGVFSLPEALQLVASRGRLMQQLPAGAMLAVPLSEAEVLPFLGTHLDLAAVNGVRLCVISGPTQALEEVEKRLADLHIRSWRLHTSHAFHSAMMDAIIAPFAEQVKRVSRSLPQIPLISNVTGRRLTQEEATSVEYWVRHLRQTVRFADGLNELLGEPKRTLLEIGPGHVLSSLAASHPKRATSQAIIPSLPAADSRQSDERSLLTAVGQLWLAGHSIDWPGFYAGQRRQRVPLPTYPFQRQRYWMDSEPPAGDEVNGDSPAIFAAPRSASATSQTAFVPLPEGEAIVEMVSAIFKDILGLEQVGEQDDFFASGGTSILVVQLVARINESFRVDLSALNLLESPTVAGLADCIEAVYRMEKQQLSLTAK